MTTIEWTHPPGYRGESWNPVTGCTKVSQGCKHCYAERVFPRAYAATGRRFTDVQTHPERLDAPLLRRAPTCWFVNSMSDLFHESVPDEFIDRVFTVMMRTLRHRYIILTKRPARMAAWISGAEARVRTALSEMETAEARGSGVWSPWPLPNVWLGVSAEDQATAAERIPLLLDTPAAVRLVSLEPLLGPIQLLDPPNDIGEPRFSYLAQVDGEGPRLDWIIVGGESGPAARPCDVAWIRGIVRQGQAAGVPMFVKQLGARVCAVGVWTPAPVDYVRLDPDGCAHYHRIVLRDRKGGDPSEWPEDLRVREWPMTQEAGR